MARRVVEPYAGCKLLDYGCGDGTLILQVRDLFPDATGADADQYQIDDCRRRLVDFPGLSFHTTTDLAGPEFNGRFELLTCMEVLEHCLPDQVSVVLGDLCRLAATGATVVISAPIEIGPALLVKQMIRVVAGWRHLGDYEYTERYSWKEMLRMLIAGPTTAIVRPVYLDPRTSAPHHGHKGFNWRSLHARLSSSFDVSQVLFSPLPFAGSLFNSQAWFVCRVRPGTGAGRGA